MHIYVHASNGRKNYKFLLKYVGKHIKNDLEVIFEKIFISIINHAINSKIIYYAFSCVPDKQKSLIQSTFFKLHQNDKCSCINSISKSKIESLVTDTV